MGLDVSLIMLVMLLPMLKDMFTGGFGGGGNANTDNSAQAPNMSDWTPAESVEYYEAKEDAHQAETEAQVAETNDDLVGAAGSALGGAAIGAAVGSVVPFFGTAVGALAGGGLGLLSYFLLGG